MYQNKDHINQKHIVTKSSDIDITDQKNLLKKACEMAPKGRTIIYSTCTMAPEENENVVSQILDEEDIDLKKININGLKLDNGVTNWKEEDYNKEVKKCARMWPHHNDTDAFFLARMEKC